MGFFFLLLFCMSFLDFLPPTYGYDALDPYGNVTIRWDLMQQNEGTQDVRVSIFNYQLFRQIDYPGWRVTWKWENDEVIWDMRGAEATEQGNCSAFRGGHLPHSCEREPVIVDLLPGAPYNMQFANCCRGGVLSSMTQDPNNYMATFQMNINSVTKPPQVFKLDLPGYTCGTPFEVAPTKFTEDHGRRNTQALGTWNVTCSYSPFLASPAPKCCVSFSAFYSKTLVPCPTCSCSCQRQPGIGCVRGGESAPVLPAPEPMLRCTHHMCPVKVHWHVQVSYREFWRVKMTITNFNYARNYSGWNLVVLHPNLQSLTQVFSFNYKPLDQFKDINDSGLFFGIPYYNDVLLQSGDGGNVQTEMLLHKDPGVFTFGQGWPFPRKVTFNGDECHMPPPDDYPMLPNTAAFIRAPRSSGCLLALAVVLVFF